MHVWQGASQWVLWGALSLFALSVPFVYLPTWGKMYAIVSIEISLWCASLSSIHNWIVQLQVKTFDIKNNNPSHAHKSIRCSIFTTSQKPLWGLTFWVQEMETSRNLSGISFDRFQHMISDLSLDQAKGRVMGWQWGDGCQPLWVPGCLWLLGWLTFRPGLNSGGWCHSEDQFHSVQNTIERPCCSREG